MHKENAPPPTRGNETVGKNRIYFRWFEASLALLGGVAFAAVGPLREAFENLPGIPVAGAFVLFMAPGALLARWTLGERFSGAALLPAGFVISTSVFALLGVPMLVFQTSLEAYLGVSGAVVALSLLAAALAALLRPPRREREACEAIPDRHGGLLWVPFVALAAVLVYVCRVNAPSFIGDIWVYLSWIREFLDGQRLAFEEPYFGDAVGLSRARINGWLLEQAAFSRISGVGPVELVFRYMNPALAVVALLAVYALARTVFRSERAALVCGCLYALFFLIDLDASRLSFGGEFVSRLAKDKMAARFVFLPMALAFAAAFLEEGRRAYLWCFALVCCAVVAIHPIGLAIIGISDGRLRHPAPGRQPPASRGPLQGIGHGPVGDRRGRHARLPDPRAHRRVAQRRPRQLGHQLGRPGRASEHGLRAAREDADLRARRRHVHDAPVAAPEPRDRGRLFRGVPVLALAPQEETGGAAAARDDVPDGGGGLRSPGRHFPGGQRDPPGAAVAPGVAHPPGRRAHLGLGSVGGVEPRGGLAREGPPRAPPRTGPAAPGRRRAHGSGGAPDDGRHRARAEPRGGSRVVRSLPLRSHLRVARRGDHVAHGGAREGHPGCPHPRLLIRGERGQPQGEPVAAGPALAGGAGARPHRGAAGLARRAGVLPGHHPREGVEILRRNEVDYVVVEEDSRLAQTLERVPGFERTGEPSERYDVYGVDLQTLGSLVENRETSQG